MTLGAPFAAFSNTNTAIDDPFLLIYRTDPFAL